MPENTKTKKKRKLTSGEKTLAAILKFMLLFIVIVIVFMIGMAVGYKYGGGQSGEVFEFSTWRNILFIIFG